MTSNEFHIFEEEETVPVAKPGLGQLRWYFLTLRWAEGSKLRMTKYFLIPPSMSMPLLLKYCSLKIKFFNRRDSPHEAVSCVK